MRVGSSPHFFVQTIFENLSAPKSDRLQGRSGNLAWSGCIPISLLTALAVVVGGAVILADPIFQGLAIALMAGEIASLLISRMAVSVLYYTAYAPKRKRITRPATAR